MAAWFGHTQTLTSISKSVSTVASGILGLEANLATFMQKVTYYEKFFHRVGANLPPEVIKSAMLLFARCYEYRDEIRDELESSLAYVADAGRWVIGMEDWNSKMEKRLAQISELVLLANSLLVEYAITGARGAQSTKDELHAYLQHIDATVVLQHGDRVATKTTPTVGIGAGSNPSADSSISMEDELVKVAAADANHPLVAPTSAVGDANKLMVPTAAPTPTPAEDDACLYANPLFPQSAPTSTNAEATNTAEGTTANTNAEGRRTTAEEEDDDSLNPFARTYQPPVSVESSLASLRGDSENGNVYYNAVESQSAITLSPGAEREDAKEEGSGEDAPESPVSMGEYECLEIDSIPNYVAFRPSVLSKKRRLKADHGRFFPEQPPVSPASSSDSNRSGKPLQPTPPLPKSPKASPLARTRKGRRGVNGDDRVGQKLMDLTYSYDFQRELTFNPFASPGMAPAPSSAIDPPPPIDHFRLESIPSVDELEPRTQGGDHTEENTLTGAAQPEIEETETETETLIPETVYYGHQRIGHALAEPAVQSDLLAPVSPEPNGSPFPSPDDEERAEEPPFATTGDDNGPPYPGFDDVDVSASFYSSDGQDELSHILDLLTPDDGDEPRT